MKYSSLLVAFTLCCLTACSQKPVETPAPAPSALPPASVPAGHPDLGVSTMASVAPKPPLTQKAQVLSTINVTQFTYLEVKQDNNTRWLATTTSAAKKGDTIQFEEGTLMTNFYSKVLNRTFPSITFVGNVVVAN